MLVVFAAFSANAKALETPLAGDWSVAGVDSKGAYTGAARVSRLEDGRYTIQLSLKYGQSATGKAFFVGAASSTNAATALAGERGEPNGIIGALDAKPKNAVAARYRLSDDGTMLDGRFGPYRERLTRTLAPTVRIVIFHTNDVHGQLLPLKTANGVRGGYAALVAKLRKERAAALAEGASVLTLDAGDIYAGTPEGDETHGIVDVDCMKLAGYDAMALGNHEFDQSVPLVKELVARAAFPVLSANLIDEGTKKLPAWPNLAASARFNVGGVKVCVVGLVTNMLKQVTTNAGSAGVNVEAELVAARRELAANADAQVNILLTHVGTEVDNALAAALEGKLAVIVGGHDHQVNQSPKRSPDADGALVVQAGKSGQWLGRIELEVDRASGKVISVSGGLLPVSPTDGEAADVAAAIEQGAGEITAKMETVLGSLSKPLPRKGQGSTPLGNFLTDAMRAHAHSDVAVYNKTGIRNELAKGEVRLRNVFEVVPFADHCVVLTLRGVHLLELLEGSVAPTIGSPPALEISGVVVTYDPKRPPGSRVRSAKVNGVPLDPEKSYRVVTSKFLSEGGDGHVAFTKGTDFADEGGTLMDALKLPFKGNLVKVPATEARWVSTGNAP